jgi:hypothetical protein
MVQFDRFGNIPGAVQFRGGVVVVGGVAVVVRVVVGVVDVEHDPETHRLLDASKHANGGQVNL